MPSCVHTMRIFPGRREFLLSVFLDSRNSPPLPISLSPFLFFPWLFFAFEPRLLDFSRALKKIHRFPSWRKTSFESAGERARLHAAPTEKEELISRCLKAHFYATLNVVTFVVTTEALVRLKENFIMRDD